MSKAFDIEAVRSGTQDGSEAHPRIARS